ncbi:RdgB/HAM1 family non-canonical purine NTP pyrophosphatase [Devosia sp.]|uniref:RdgB/HAM1 family non-canonical purine NTP pyrophosphatase n=1 Tax=Devosia sp. TaxID=1871048 RepID=UPI003A8DF2C0
MAGKLTLRRGDRLVIATHNAGKLEEFRALLSPYGLDIVSAGELGLPEPEETGTTFVENARLKGHAAAKAADCIALADDSGLSVDALDGQPGVYTANWAETPTGRDFDLGMRRVEDKLTAVGAIEPAQRSGSFNATFCLAHPDGRDDIFTGKVDGTLVWPPRGDSGHGFDPVFMPRGYDITFGEMQSAVKNGISHRARAFAEFVTGALGGDIEH